MPQIRHQFVVDRPVGEVWEFFQDIPSVAECMPGVELTEDRGDGTYGGKMKVKLGPISAQFQGDAVVGELDVSNRTGSFSAKGVDRQGGNRASATVMYGLIADEGRTNVEVQADLTLQGALAQFGRTGLIQEVSARLTNDFAQCLEAKLVAGTTEEAADVRAADVKGFSLFLKSLWSWITSKFRRRPREH